MRPMRRRTFLDGREMSTRPTKNSNKERQVTPEVEAKRASKHIPVELIFICIKN